MGGKPEQDRCELCGRVGVGLTRHHLIPRTRHRNKRTRRRYSRVELNSAVLHVCRPCHKQIHAMFTGKELETHFHTGERLRSHPHMRRFIDWIADKPAGFVPKTHHSRSQW
jgi:ribosome-binding protein aMBF1 (putative translation factor)